MMRLALILAGLSMLAGCQLQSVAPSSGSAPGARPEATAPEMRLSDVRLGNGSRITALDPAVRNRVVDDMRFRAAEAGMPGAAVEVQLTTVAELESRHLFSHSYLSDDSQVVLATSEGRFEVADPADGSQPGKVYSKLMGMFDPTTGETLGLGYRP